MLETLQNASHLEVHKDMIRWILKVNILYIATENHGNKIFETFLITLGLFPYFPCGIVAPSFTLLDFYAARYMVSIIVYTIMFLCHKQRLFLFFFLFFFLQTFNTIKKLRESSSSSPVAETEGNVMEEVKAICNS